MLKRILRTTIFSYRPVEIAFSRITGVVIMAMMLLTATDVIGRYVFNSPIQGSYEITEFMLVAVVFLGIAYVQLVKGHVKVEVATSWLPQRAQLALDIFAYFIGLVMFSLITWQSGIYAWDAFVTKEYTWGLLQLPLWPAKSFVTIGCAFLAIQYLADIITDSARLVRGVNYEE